MEGLKMIIKININKDPKGPGYIAVAKEAPMFWSKAPTIEAVIEKFNVEYENLLKIQFNNNKQLEFDFHIMKESRSD